MVDTRKDEHDGRASVPSGTVTFLFTDIQGSTQLLERLREQYATVLADQRDLLRAAFAKWNGHEIDTQGDAFFVAFPRALDAACCAIDAQRALAAHPWTKGVTVSVRMGLHTGEPIIARTGYVGMDVNLAARIAGVGHGGQVLVSQTTRDLIYQDLPIGASLRDLGAHKLKDIRYPQPIYQLNIQGLPCEFPPLKALSAAEEPPFPGEPPFKGLQYFDEADADLFFGREQMTATVVEYVRHHCFLAVIGASGSGKSSIVRAGLIPALRREPGDGRTRWQIHVITPTAHPLEALATALTRTAESVTATTTLMDDLARDLRSLHLFVRKNVAGANVTRMLLVVDQFEELYTLCRHETERRAFVDNLLYAAETEGSPTTLVITLRADFYEHLAHYATLREQCSKHQEYIGPMNAAELRLAIEEPAKRGNWEFAPGLVDLMLHDIGADADRQPEPGALPLLSHALLEIWKRRRGAVMTFKGYSEAGGVRGAIAKTAESVHQNLSDEQQAIARNIFLRLTELGEGTQDTRRRAPFGELIPPFADAHAAEVVLKTLADARLITTSEGYAEVAHEALIREWHRLREWLNENREGLRLHRHLTESAHAWQELNREPGELYRGARLAQAHEWAKTSVGELNALEREFLDASEERLEREEVEREAQRQRELVVAQKLAETQTRAAQQLQKRAMFLAGALLVAAVLAFAAVWFAQQSNENAQQARTERNNAEYQRQVAFARELSVNAVNNLSADPERSILLALQAVSVSSAGGKPVLLEAEEALHRAVQASRVLLTLRGHSAGLNQITVSPDGKRLATASNDKTAKVWDAATGKELLTLAGHAFAVNAVAFSPDGKRLATGSVDKTAKVWDAVTGKELLNLCCHSSSVRSVTFSPDGKRLATSSEDKTAKVWDADTGKALLTLIGHTGGVNHIVYSPDGRRLATSGWGDELEHVAKVWDAVTGKQLLTLTAESTVWDVAFSPDGKLLAMCNKDQVKIWNSASGQLLSTIFNPVLGARIAFSPDGTRLATGNSDGTAKLWDVATGQLLQTLAGHTGNVLDVSFSLDGTRLATVSNDGTAKVWDVSPAGSREWLTLAQNGAVLRLAYSPDGTRLATTGLDGTAKVWNALTGKELLTLSGHTGELRDVHFSPDGSRLATTSIDKTLKVWDAATGKQLLSIYTSSFSIPWGLRVAFSPDGRRIAEASADNTVKVWDAVTGKELLTLCCHPPPTATGVAFSPDGTRLATTGIDGTAKVWDAATGKELLTLSGHKGGILHVTYSPDGRRLATASTNGTAKIWDAMTGQTLLTLSGHTGGIFDVAFSPDGERVATASGDGTAKVWDASIGSGRSEQPLTLYNPNGISVKGVAFSPDSKRLAVSSNDGTARIYALPPDDIITIAKSRVTRRLTADECKKFLHVAQCP